MAQRKRLTYVLHCVIGICCMFGFGLLPAVSPITPAGMKILGVFIGSIYMWSFIDILWPSLLGLVALCLTEYAPMGTIMQTSFGDSVSILIILSMVLFGAIQEAGVTNYISRWFLTRKIINGRPIVFSFIFIFCTYVLAALSASILPAILFMWAILYGVLSDVGYQKGDKYATLMVIGTYFGAMVGHGAKPFVATGLILTGAFTKVTNIEINYLTYMLYGIIMAVLSIIVYCLIMKYIFRPDTSKIANISANHFEKDVLPPMKAKQKVLFVSLFAFLLLMLIPSIFPKDIWFIAFLNKIGNNGIALMFLGVLCMIHVDKEPVIDFIKIASKYVSWDIFCLVALVMVISGALTDESTGIINFLTVMLDPILGGKSPFVFAVLVLGFALVFTNFTNNTVLGVMILPVLYSYAKINGANLAGIGVAMIFMVHYAIITPAASIYSAVLHGNYEWVDSKQVVAYTSIVLVFIYLLYIVVGIPLANAMF